MVPSENTVKVLEPLITGSNLASRKAHVFVGLYNEIKKKQV
jgi:hypothetical protein